MTYSESTPKIKEPAPANKAKGEIEVLLDLIDAKIGAIEKNIKILIEKINPILANTPPTALVGEDKKQASSTIGQLLMEDSYRLNNIIDTLGNAIERVEL